MTEIPNFIAKHITDTNKCIKIDIGNECGRTDYIDFLTASYFPDNSNVVWGWDCYKRFFISVLYQDEENNKPRVMTIFQRYTDNPYYYASCGGTFVYGSDVRTHSFRNDDYPMEQQFVDFFTLINTGKVCVKFTGSDSSPMSINYKLN